MFFDNAEDSNVKPQAYLEGDTNRSIEYKREARKAEHHQLRYNNDKMKINIFCLFAAVSAYTLQKMEAPDFDMDQWLEEHCEKSGNNWNCNFERK